MTIKIWATSEDDSIEYMALTADYLEGALGVLRKSFYRQEAASVAVGIAKDDEAMDEIDDFVKTVAKEGVSLIALDKKTNAVCGVAFNKLQAKKTGDEASDFHRLSEICRRPPAKDLIKFMDKADKQTDLFALCEADCLLEIMFLSTLENYGNRGIATKLCEVSVRLARTLRYDRENVKQDIDGKELELEPIPEAVCALFTVPKSRRIGRRLNWTIAVTLGYEIFFTNGEPFSKFLPSDNRFTTVEYFII
ncbi:uncharacterized protein LOC130450137 [Diorhabda sublineata]|uniref:uncharacterized protein LOC130450137 n=1 Tax=Diorhabda sublineata TaxID=1163346 RepID=UPI0024E07A4D|nr:uncharacterized protein LOC130450137 [Diorhabda sublineata]